MTRALSPFDSAFYRFLVRKANQNAYPGGVRADK